MDLTHERRRLICAGRLFRTDSIFERKGMYELFVLLFDNYRTRRSYRAFQWASKLSGLFCSCDNTDHRDGFRYRFPSIQTSKTIELLPFESLSSRIADPT